MLIVIPVSSSDISTAPDFPLLVQKFGPYPNHKVVFVSRPSEVEHAKILMDQISGLFGGSDLYVLRQECSEDYPQKPNFFWEDTCRHLEFERGNKLPWLWLGLDSTPLRSGWIDAIETEYNLAKMPFLGVFKSHEEGEYLGGTAVYPANIGEFSILCSYASKMPIPFDLLCRWEFTPRAHNSELFQCAAESENPPHDKASSKAVLLTGPNDGSVAEAILDSDEPTTAPAPSPMQVNADTLIPRRKRSRAAV
jgi:hypothetical protein